MRRLPLLAAVALAAVLAAGCGEDTTGTTGATGGSTTTTATTTASSSSGAGPSLGRLESGVVATVNDGDTITLRDGRKIRLLQIDAPELYDDCFGRKSRETALELMPVGTTVTLQKDADLDSTDRYGRLLRYVESKGLNVNAELVVLGAAVPYFFRNERGRYARELLSAVGTAREHGVGLWKACPRAELNTGLGSLTGPA